MSKPIEVNDISKKYRISHRHKAQYRSFREDVTAAVTKPFKVLLGQTDDIEEFWALKDVSFSVNEGEVMGIVGRNGSGKSTLLKILSRIVEPTSGSAILRGKTASLLEVGTGFHPELTGRENIYFNGSVLGMKKREIDRKFDEIVAFAETEKFLDTPVKFYSSGMYVRLAFAVAAHLEPDILIVDEVLAVGDAEFQKKCLGRMQNIAEREGRTVLFVSHNMASVRQLCTKGLLLDQGTATLYSDVQTLSASYLQKNFMAENGQVSVVIPRKVKFFDFSLNGHSAAAVVKIISGDTIEIAADYESLDQVPYGLQIGYGIKNINTNDFPVFTHSGLEGEKHITGQTGRVVSSLKVPRLAPGAYSLEFHAWLDGELLETEVQIARFEIEEAPAFKTGVILSDFPSSILVDSEWKFSKK